MGIEGRKASQGTLLPSPYQMLFYDLLRSPPLTLLSVYLSQTWSGYLVAISLVQLAISFLFSSNYCNSATGRNSANGHNRPITKIQPLIVIQPMTEYFQPLVLYYLVILLAVLFVYSCYISLSLLYLV